MSTGTTVSLEQKAGWLWFACCEGYHLIPRRHMGDRLCLRCIEVRRFSLCYVYFGKYGYPDNHGVVNDYLDYAEQKTRTFLLPIWIAQFDRFVLLNQRALVSSTQCGSMPINYTYTQKLPRGRKHPLCLTMWAIYQPKTWHSMLVQY